MYITAAVRTIHLLHAVMLWRTQNSYMYSTSDLEQLGVNSASQFFMLCTLFVTVSTVCLQECIVIA